MGRATHSSRGRPAGQANGASRLRRALDSPHSCRLAPSIRDAAEIPVQEISQPDAREPGLAEVRATSLEDREVEHRGKTAGGRHWYHAVPGEEALRFLLAGHAFPLDVGAALLLHQ